MHSPLGISRVDAQSWRRRYIVIPQEQKQIVRRGYDKLSFAYRADDTPDDYQDYAAWVSILAERLPGGSPVLDIGCGCGLPATKVLAERFDVTGVDFSDSLTSDNCDSRCPEVLSCEKLVVVASFDLLPQREYCKRLLLLNDPGHFPARRNA